MSNFEEAINFGEAELRELLEAQLYREKVQEAVLDELDVKPTEEQVWARHILVPDQGVADQVLAQLNDGADWSELAAIYSTDESNKDRGGDLGWFSRGRMVPEFEEVAFALEVGEISEPVETTFGAHIIQVLGHEERPLSQAEYDQLRQTKFDEWLSDMREAAEIEIRDYWSERVPAEPTLPVELQNFIQQVQASQQQQQGEVPLPPEVPTPLPQEAPEATAEQ
ncbi:MAG: peptidylprolyl isomerase [Candidatus Thorarchaeota archaeon]